MSDILNSGEVKHVLARLATDSERTGMTIILLNHDAGLRAALKEACDKGLEAAEWVMASRSEAAGKRLRDELTELRRIADGEQESVYYKALQCTWARSEEGSYNIYSAGCGPKFLCDMDGHGFTFCPYCGKRIEERE